MGQWPSRANMPVIPVQTVNNGRNEIFHELTYNNKLHLYFDARCYCDVYYKLSRDKLPMIRIYSYRDMVLKKEESFKEGHNLIISYKKSDWTQHWRTKYKHDFVYYPGLTSVIIKFTNQF